LWWLVGICSIFMGVEEVKLKGEEGNEAEQSSVAASEVPSVTD